MDAINSLVRYGKPFSRSGVLFISFSSILLFSEQLLSSFAHTLLLFVGVGVLVMHEWRFIRIPRGIGSALCLVFISCMVSILFAFPRFDPFEEFFRLTALMLLFVLMFSQRTSFRKFVIPSVVGVSVMGQCVALAYYLVGPSAFGVQPMGGLFGVYNWWAIYLTFSIPFLLVWVHTEERFFLRGIGVIVTALMMTGVLLTTARASWFSLAAALVLGYAVYGVGLYGSTKTIPGKAIRSFAFVWFSLGTLVLVGVFLCGNPEVLLGRFRSSFMIDSPTAAAAVQTNIPFDTALLHRSEVMRVGFAIFQDHWLTGIGPMNFGRYYGVYQQTPWLFSRYPHSEYLGVLVEYGLVGVVAGVLFLYTAGFLLVRSFRRNAGEWSLQHGAACVALVSFALNGVFESASVVNTVSVYVVILLGWLLSEHVSSQDRVFSLPSPRIGSALLLVLMGGAFWWQMSIVFFQQATALKETNPSRADALYARALAMNPWQAFSILERGRMSYTEGKYEEAVDFFARSYSVDPFISETLLDEAIAVALQEDEERSEILFKELIARFPYVTPRYRNAYARLLLQQDREIEAEAVYQETIERFPINDVYLTYQHLYGRMNYHLTETYIQGAELARSQGHESEAVALEGVAYELAARAGILSPAR